jgi:hypothetical protein
MRVFTMLFVTACCSLQMFAQDRTDSGEVPVQLAATSDTADAGTGTAAQTPQNAGQQPGIPAPTHPTATTYSNGYEVRLKIHKYASWATLPLFATEIGLGQSLYNHPESGAKKTAHGIVGTGIVGLFAVNTFTGGWNLWEGRHDTDGRRLRILHSVLMVAATGGFVATAATGPHVRNGIITNPSDKSLHRNIALASIGTGTAGYLLMLFKGK